MFSDLLMLGVTLLHTFGSHSGYTFIHSTPWHCGESLPRRLPPQKGRFKAHQNILFCPSSKVHLLCQNQPVSHISFDVLNTSEILRTQTFSQSSKFPFPKGSGNYQTFENMHMKLFPLKLSSYTCMPKRYKE